MTFFVNQLLCKNVYDWHVLFCKKCPYGPRKMTILFVPIIFFYRETFQERPKLLQNTLLFLSYVLEIFDLHKSYFLSIYSRHFFIRRNAMYRTIGKFWLSLILKFSSNYFYYFFLNNQKMWFFLNSFSKTKLYMLKERGFKVSLLYARIRMLLL